MTDHTNIVFPEIDKERVDKIAKRLSIEKKKTRQYISVIIRDSVKLMEKYLFLKTPLHLEKSYVDNEGLIELKSNIDKGNNPGSNTKKYTSVLYGVRDLLEDLKKENLTKLDIDFHLKKINEVLKNH